MKKLAILLAALMAAAAFTGCTAKELSETTAPVTVEPTESVAPTEKPAANTNSSLFGNLSGNIQSGGFAVEGDGYVFYEKNGALYSLKDGEATLNASEIYKGSGESGSMRQAGYTASIRSLNYWDGRLYFVADTGKKDAYTGDGAGEDYVYERVYSVKPDGSDLREVTPEKPNGGCLYSSGADGKSDITYKVGYDGFTILDGDMYYLTSVEDAQARRYETSAPDDLGGKLSISYSPIALCRAKIPTSGGKLTETYIAEDVGNCPTYFCTDGKRIYYIETLVNPYYAPYNFVTVYACGLDGSGRETVFGGVNAAADVLYVSDRSDTTLYLAGIQVSGDKLYFSRRESQGDFNDSWLDFKIMSNGSAENATEMFTEYGMVKSLVTDDAIYHSLCDRTGEGSITTASIYCFNEAVEGHSLDVETVKLTVPESSYTLNTALNLVGGRLFVKTWSYEGGESVSSTELDSDTTVNY